MCSNVGKFLGLGLGVPFARVLAFFANVNKSVHFFNADPCLQKILSPNLKLKLHCVSKKDTDVAGYIFNAHQPILVVFGRDIGERVCY